MKTKELKTCPYCGVELVGKGCINMCWVLAGDPNPYKKEVKS